MMTVQFTLRNLTKGAVRYEELPSSGGEAKIGGLYLRKSAFPSGQYPTSLTVTINWPRPDSGQEKEA